MPRHPSFLPKIKMVILYISLSLSLSLSLSDCWRGCAIDLYRFYRHIWVCTPLQACPHFLLRHAQSVPHSVSQSVSMRDYIIYILYDYTQHNDIHHNDTQHNDIQHYNKKIRHSSKLTLSLIIQNVRAECHYVKCGLCWASQLTPLYWMSLCWVSLCWMSLCWVSWGPLLELSSYWF